MDRKVAIEVINSFSSNIKAGLLLNVLTFFVSYLTGFVMSNIDQFVAITAVLIMDSMAGIACAIKFRKFQTKKALKFVWYFVGYTALLTVCLLVEKAFVGAFWLSETVVVPIITFQVISILKNMHRFGLISSEHLGRLLEKVDKYKDDE